MIQCIAKKDADCNDFPENRNNRGCLCFSSKMGLQKKQNKINTFYLMIISIDSNQTYTPLYSHDQVLVVFSWLDTLVGLVGWPNIYSIIIHVDSFGIKFI